MSTSAEDAPAAPSREHCDRLRLALDVPDASEAELLERVGRMWLAGFLLVPRADLDALLLRALMEPDDDG